MLCTIYVSHYRLKTKYKNLAWNAEQSSYNQSFLEKHNKREYFYFTPWVMMFEDIDIEKYQNIKHICKCLQIPPYNFHKKPFAFLKPELDWFPDMRKNEIDILCIKVVDSLGNIIDYNQFYNAFHLKERNYQYSWSYEQHQKIPYRHLLRHPQTTQEKRMKFSPEEKREYERQGYRIKERGKRSQRNLRDSFDDIFMPVSFCWKDRYKKKRQYL